MVAQDQSFTSGQISKIFLDAAALIERDGWAQLYSYGKDGKSMCLVTALVRSCGQRYVIGSLYRTAEATLQTYLNDYYYDYILTMDINPLAKWNDRPHRTKDQVLKMLRDAAQALSTNELNVVSPPTSDGGPGIV